MRTTTGVELVDVLADAQHVLLACLEELAVMVADDVAERSILYAALHVDEVIEAFVALGVLRTLFFGQLLHILHGHERGVDHLVLGGAWVYVRALERDLGRGSVEVLELELAHFATVHGVGKVTAEELYVELVGTETDLLVRVEGDANLAVLHLGMCLEIHHGGDDLGDASLVVGSE